MVTLKYLSFKWATVIMWVLSGEVRLWSSYNPRLVRGWVIQVMKVECVRRWFVEEESFTNFHETIMEHFFSMLHKG